MPSGSYKKKIKQPKQTRNDPPAGLDDYIHDIGQFPVSAENVRKFMYVYNHSEDAFQNHQIADYEINGEKHTIDVPPLVASAIVTEFMKEHPVMLHQMLQTTYRERTAPNKMGKFVPKTVVYFNRQSANLGFDKVGRSMSYHGTKMFLDNKIDSFDDDRPSAIDAIYSADMVNKMHGEVNKKHNRRTGARRAFASKKLAGGSMLLEDADERKKLKDAMYPFTKFIHVKVDEDDDEEDDESDDNENDDDEAMDDVDDDDDDLDERNERRRRQGKIAKKTRRKAPQKSKTKQKKKTLPFKRGDNKKTTSTSSTSREVEIDASLMDQERARRQTTVEATRQSEERKGKVIRGTAENSLKRRALASQFESATVPLDDIFGNDPKKQWSEHPKFHELVQKAATYVDKLGFSSPGKGQSETMHSMARKLDVQLQAKKQPSKKILVEAIVITKLKQLDPVDAHNYQ